MIHTARLARAAVSPPVRRRTRHVHASDRRTSDAQQAARAGHSTYSTIGEGVIGKVDHRKKGGGRVARSRRAAFRHARAVLAARDHLHTHDRARSRAALEKSAALVRSAASAKSRAWRENPPRVRSAPPNQSRHLQPGRGVCRRAGLLCLGVCRRAAGRRGWARRSESQTMRYYVYAKAGV